jgi:brefeldin A-inhibited guanine nucleotide-exchange protein
VTDIIRGAIDFDDEAFLKHLSGLYDLITDLLGKEVHPEMRFAIRDYLKRVKVVKGF